MRSLTVKRWKPRPPRRLNGVNGQGYEPGRARGPAAAAIVCGGRSSPTLKEYVIMAMFPSLMHDSLFGDLFDDPFFTGLRRVSDTPGTVMSGSMMNTDVRETDKGYAVDIDMPGFKKEDIAVELKNGYLTSAPARAASTWARTSRIPTSTPATRTARCAWSCRSRRPGSRSSRSTPSPSRADRRLG